MRPFARRRRDDRGSIAVSMLVMTAGIGLSAVMVTSSMQIISGARNEQSRAYALQAARSGLSNALTSFRSALDSELQGSVTKLPCSSYLSPSKDFNPQITGYVGSATGTTTAAVANDTARNPGFTVYITYLTTDPTGHSDAWIAANGSPCTTTSLPTYAYLKSVGRDPVRNVSRTLYGIYTFRTALNANTSGGQIHAYRPGPLAPDLCLDAGAMTAGTTLTMQPCASPVTPQQTFAYQPGLEITIGTGADELCVKAGDTQVSGNPLTLQTCATTASTAAPQRWSYNSAGAFLGTTGTTSNSFCWSRVSSSVNSLVQLSTSTCTTAASSNWTLDPTVGPGGAGQLIPKSQLQGYNLHASQLVNYAQFSQCLAFVSGGAAVKLNQCKQSPTLDITNNYDQSWAWPSDGQTGPIFAYDNPRGTFLCLTLPIAGTAPAAVTVTGCVGNPLSPSTMPANQIWWSRGASTTAADLRYRLEGLGNWAGLCLTSVTNAGVKSAWVAGCDTTAVEKWNAVATSSPAGLTSIGEK
jgi:hypothetical protein